MPIVNAFSNAVVRDFSIEELEQAACLMRGYSLVGLCAARSGDAGGTLSAMETAAALYLKVAIHDPNDPGWPQRDRIVWSDGHKPAALYQGLAFAGYFPIEDTVMLRKFYSSLQGRMQRSILPGVEAPGVCQGQGLRVAVGMALAGQLNQEDHTVFCFMSDTEQQESSVWEAAMAASVHELDNLIAIVERNRQAENAVTVESLSERYRSYGWEVVEIDGHNICLVVNALQEAKSFPVAGKPTVIVANTVSGKGVGFMENVAGWYGKAPTYDELVNALDELGLKDVIAYDTLLNLASAFHERVEYRPTAKRRLFALPGGASRNFTAK
jgi:transketolase